MSKPFQPISEILKNSSPQKPQSFNEIYGEPENFLEIEVRISHQKSSFFQLTFRFVILKLTIMVEKYTQTMKWCVEYVKLSQIFNFY